MGAPSCHCSRNNRWAHHPLCRGSTVEWYRGPSFFRGLEPATVAERSMGHCANVHLSLVLLEVPQRIGLAPQLRQGAAAESACEPPVGGNMGNGAVCRLHRLAALLPLLGIMGRLVTLPAEAEPITMPAEMPFVTVFLLLVMSAIVAGIVEEAAFRGYMQGPIERRYGPAVAILINGVVFGLAHYNHHPTSVLVMLPFYVGVSAVYGGLTSATNSILPGVVLHAGGDVFTLARMWTAGKSEWQLSAAAPRLIWETGVDFTFLWSVTVFVVLGASTVWAYSALARTAREREDSIGTFDRK